MGARDREGLERLCRYLCRPPVSLDRLEVLGDGRVAYKLRRAWSDGTTSVVFTEAELVRRLVALIPPPRANQVHYHGVLSGRHRWKARIAPRGGRIAPRNKSRKLLRGTQRRTRHLAWAALLWRTFGEDGWK